MYKYNNQETLERMNRILGKATMEKYILVDAVNNAFSKKPFITEGQALSESVYIFTVANCCIRLFNGLKIEQDKAFKSEYFAKMNKQFAEDVEYFQKICKEDMTYSND